MKSQVLANSAFLRTGVHTRHPRAQGEPLYNNTKNVRNNNINTLDVSGGGIPAPAARRTHLTPERAIQRALLSRLATCLPLGAVVLHVPNEDATGSPAYGQAKIRDGVMPGCPDLLIVHQGRAYWLELKAPDGTVSDSQFAAHRRLRMAGTPVEVAYSVEDALAALEGWGLRVGEENHPTALSGAQKPGKGHVA